jgi:endo-1,4-beta-xylanase
MLLAVAGVVAGACARPATPDTNTTSAATTAGSAPAPRASALPRLADVFKAQFTVGAALNERQFLGTDVPGDSLVRAQFNTISPENVLKWERVHPAADRYDFAAPDAYVAYGEKHRMFIVGHTLVWHSQTPRWVFEDAAGKPLTRDALLARMREHITTVVGRYKGRIHGWDVVNEALEEDGTLRKSPWLRIIGDDFIELAFQYAHDADPKAELYYNDYSLENPAKRAGAIALITRLKQKGIPIKAVGMQAHFKMDWPSVGLEDSTISMFAALGVQVNVTELDIDILPPVVRGTSADVATRGAVTAASNPWAAGLPEERQRALAQRYADMFAVFLKHQKSIDRVTFWGVADGDSWLNDWPARGRTSYPLLFDRSHRPKPAFDAVVSTVSPKVP